MSKALAMGAVLMGLSWALWSVQDVVREREDRRGQAERSVVNSLAASQTLLGPMLLRRCTESWQTTTGEGKSLKYVPEQRELQLILPPQTVQANSNVAMEPRHRGIFKVNGYALKAQVDVVWGDLQALVPKPQHANSVIQCEAPVVSVGITDGRGIRTARLSLQGQDLPVVSGTQHPLHVQGFHAALPVAWMADGAVPARLQGQLTLELAGTRALAVAPVADRTEWTLSAAWPHPSFGGRFLPAERQITPQGFTAAWRVTSLATTAQRDLLKGLPLCQVSMGDQSQAMAMRRYTSVDSGMEEETPKPGSCVETFGVDFVDPVNPYVLSDRATKYGLLFIVLTFVGVILVEVLNRLRVHPIQYLLVGMAMTLFFLLLVSLSEHMAFALAYTIAAGACTGLLTFYASHILDGWRRGLVFGLGTSALYGTLYALLQLEQSALVLGSFMLFAVLAVIMVMTRRLDWYALFDQMRGQDTPAA